MMQLEEAEHVYRLLTGSMLADKMRLVEQLRDVAIAANKERPATVKEGHDLTVPYHADHFAHELSKEVLPPRLGAAINLLRVCASAIDNGSINADAIRHAYAAMDDARITGLVRTETDRVKTETARNAKGKPAEARRELLKTVARDKGWDGSNPVSMSDWKTICRVFRTTHPKYKKCTSRVHSADAIAIGLRPKQKSRAKN
jgi:hypothetical protein